MFRPLSFYIGLRYTAAKRRNHFISFISLTSMIGLMLGVAVLIDATIIRSVLLPASMKLLGDWNWYLPSWLEWLPSISAGEEAELPEGRVHAFVHGEAEEIRQIRAHLLRDRGVAKTDLSCSPYWRRGMDDEQWRSVKKQFVIAMEGDTA